MKVHVAVVDQRLQDGPVALDVDALLGGSVGRFSLWQSREESLGGGGSVKGSLYHYSINLGRYGGQTMTHWFRVK